MHNTLNLCGVWELAGFDGGQGDWDRAAPPYPVPAEVPGEVHPSLHKAGVIGDPYYGLNPDGLNWVAEKEWWYRRKFTVPEGFRKQRTYLEFDGLDTFAAVFLNGEFIGTSDDMFITHTFDVSSKVTECEEHLLEVRFSPARKICSLLDYHSYLGQFDMIRIGARKMQCSFGWDWAPELTGAGVWRSVRLVSYEAVSLRSIHAKPSLRGTYADILVEAELVNHTASSVDATVTATLAEAPGAVAQSITVPPQGVSMELLLKLDNSQLWWPNGLGDQPLYSALLTLESNGDLLEAGSERFGIRTVELSQCSENGEPEFVFVVNGVRVFAKGANWIPADHFPSQVSRERYRELIELARDANYNMLRVWGGGIYEPPVFYDLCDEMGIMVWQDFMYTLAEYPETPDHIENARREANQVVRDLRNHASLVLWCGNNECEMSLAPEVDWPGKKIFHEIIPQVVAELDGTRPFWPSSPYGGPVANSPEYGDSHGGAWFGTAVGDVRLWRELILAEESRFVSEFYAQGPPEIESIREFIPDGQMMPLRSHIWELHNPDNIERHKLIGASQQESLVRFVHEMMGEPRTPEEFALLGGILQGEFMQAEIHHHRLQKFGTGGSLFWMFNDTWPSVSYSIVDYFLRPKPAYYYARRALAPVTLAFSKEADTVGAWVLNDSTRPLNATVRTSRHDVRDNEPDYATILTEIPANASARVWTGAQGADTADEVLTGVLEVDGAVLSQASYFFTIFAGITFPDPGLRVQHSRTGKLIHFSISTDRYARCVHFSGLPAAARLSDNYFDLFPGQTKVVSISGVSESELRSVQVQTL